MLSIAVPKNPIVTDVIEGSTGGPRGLCQSAVVYNFELQTPFLSIICRLVRLLMQVIESNNSAPGVPNGAVPS